MRKLILIAHISLDGFVAGPSGELDGFEKGEWKWISRLGRVERILKN